MSDFRGASTGDVMMGLATFSLLVALLLPFFRARAFDSMVEGAAAEVESLSVAARGVFDRTGVWPPAAAVGVIPDGTAGTFAPDSTLVRKAYTLQWSGLDVVEEVEAPPSVNPLPADADAPPDSVGPRYMQAVRGIGGIVLHSGNDALLAALLARYGPDVSFVRDTSWTLMVDRPGGSD